MKKLLMILTVLLVFALAGCDTEIPDYTEQLETISEDIQQIETIEVERIVEVPVIQIVEVPQIITETQIVEIEREVIIEVPMEVESKSMFFTADTDLAIFVVSLGEISYIMEWEYTDTLTQPPMANFIQIEKQVNGVPEDWFFADEATMDEEFSFEVTGEEDFDRKMQEINDEMCFECMEEIYTMFYNDYYEVENTLEIDVVAEFGVTYSGTLVDYYDTVVYRLDFPMGTNVTVTVTTNSSIDINAYDNTLIYYNWYDFETFPSGTNTYTFDCINGGTYYFEVEQFGDGVVEFEITFTNGNQTA